MKTLTITSYVTISSRPEFSRNKTGFGYMVLDIARAVGKKAHVDVLASDSRGKSFKIDNVTFLERSFWKMLKNIFSCLSPLVIGHLWSLYRMGKGELVRLVYYWLMTGYLQHLLLTGQYDVVHIHGCGFRTELWMNVCKRCNQKFVVTLHGLNSFSDSVKMEKAGKLYERDFLKRVVEGEFPITVISTGMKRLIEQTYGEMNCPNITVVRNSFSFDVSNNDVLGLPIRQQYGIPQNAKVLLYVGNISPNKNQIQMVEAFGLLPEELQDNTFVLFCGRLNRECGVEEAIAKQPNRDHLILCGSVDKTEMPNYYEAANGVVLLSHSEGFGLSLVEGMHFGLPCMMFNDMDAFQDIYNPCGVVAVSERSNETVAEGLTQLVSQKWNSDDIKAYSKKFESDTMAQNYVEIYKCVKDEKAVG